MTENTATDMVDSRTRMLPPLVVFGVACFLFAGALKFNLKGGDIWFARPMGTPVTCLFIGLVGYVAARWFFGIRPNLIPNRLLAAAVVLLPLMGLLGVIEGALHPVPAETKTLMGGTLGAMLAGPRAFGSLGTTIAGIVFAILALLGGYLARRITMPVTEARTEDPYAALKAVSTKRSAAMETADKAVAVAEEPPAAVAKKSHGDLFPVDAELEPEPAAIEIVEAVRPMGGSYRRRVEDSEPEAPPPEPVRAPILSGLVDVAEETEDAGPAAPFFAASLMHETEEAMELDVSTLTLDEEPMAVETESEMDDEPRALPHPVLEPDEDLGAEADFETDDDDAEIEARVTTTIEESNDPPASEATGEAPDLGTEWIAAPAAFHMPRAIQDEIAANEGLMDILDVENAEEEPEAQAEVEAAVEPEPDMVVERPRFRIKADFVREEPREQPVALPEPMELEIEVEAPVEVEAAVEPEPEPEMVAEPEPAAFLVSMREAEEEPAAPAPEEPSPAVEAQLEFATDETATPSQAEEAPSPRPRRRMRSAAKDWATWEETPKDRPRLRLVKSEEAETEQLEVPMERGDDAYEKAVAVVVAEDRCSVSLLQRNLGVTFGEATALIDRMYQQGVVGPYQPTGRREVLKKKNAASAENG